MSLFNDVACSVFNCVDDVAWTAVFALQNGTALKVSPIGFFFCSGIPTALHGQLLYFAT